MESPPPSSFAPDPPPRKPVSIMRRFLESGVDFKWPDNVGECSGTHCVLKDSRIPLEWQRRISDTKAASIDVYKGGRDYLFKEAFVVKTIRGSDDISSRTRAAKEVENMKDLRHPHVAALLGTYLHLTRLSILIYPAARCDLHQFLKNISKELKPFCGNLPDSPVSTESAGTDPRPRSRGELPSHNYEEDFPLNLALAEKVDHLRRYFVCLSQALNYIHESDVRHKDVKPANVLIDSSGSVILTDFGISRRFAKSTSHVTNDRWECTKKYASPELMKGKKVPRDDPSDVFSLGCVFLEMATLILGKDHDDFRAFIGTNEDAYCSKLERVHQWIGNLEGSKQPAQTSTLDASLVRENVESHDFMPRIDHGMMDCLATIRQMLNENPSNRPRAKGLWKGFQSLSPRICDDCDERNETRWRPSIRQQQNTESGVSRRQSQHLIHSPDSARNPNSRLSPESVPLRQHRPSSLAVYQPNPVEQHLRQQRASFSSVSQQAPSNSARESVSPPRFSVYHNQVNPHRPSSPRSVQSNSRHPGSPQISGVTISGFPPDERERHTETPNFTRPIPTSNGTTFSNSLPANILVGPKGSSHFQVPNSQASNSTQQTMKLNSGKIRQNRTPSEEKMLPSTEIIVYDKEDQLPYVTVFSSLKGARYHPPLQSSI